MQENDETGNTLSVDYTFDPHFALGLYAKRDIGGKEFYTIGPQLNTLLKRWNLPDGQGNIFGMTGAGRPAKAAIPSPRPGPLSWPITRRVGCFSRMNRV